eukprot:450648-Pleurochrysis_carterae.AAC.1
MESTIMTDRDNISGTSPPARMCIVRTCEFTQRSAEPKQQRAGVEQHGCPCTPRGQTSTARRPLQCKKMRSTRLIFRYTSIRIISSASSKRFVSILR